MNLKKFYPLFVLVMVAALLVAACGPTAQENAVAVMTEYAKLTPTVSVDQAVALTLTAKPTQQFTPAAPTVTPTPLPTEVPAQPQDSCVLDKIATWSEASSSNPYRIEVGGHGVQNVDFYPRGVKAISYIVGAIAPSDTPAIWHGFGSAWEGQLPACANFDFVTDATNYARARTDSGHSGLVIDLRGGNFTVVANVSNMTQDEINSLLALHKAAMDPTK